MESRHNRTWHSTFRDVRRSGDISAAVGIARAAAQAGDPLALVELAIAGQHADLEPDEADQIVERVHLEANIDDYELQFALYQAYELYLGLCSPEQKPRRSFEHLVNCATHSPNSLDSFAVANNFQYGNMVTAPNEIEALKWYQRASQLGHPDSMLAIDQLLRARCR